MPEDIEGHFGRTLKKLYFIPMSSLPRYAVVYMDDHKLPKKILHELADHKNTVLKGGEEWIAFLESLGVKDFRHVKIATEGALVGILLENGFNPQLVIVSDDAGQFNVLLHALCWIHAERSIKKLDGFSVEQRESLENKIWKTKKRKYGN